MNFEIIDNLYQIFVLLLCMLFSGYFGLKSHRRSYFMLALGYGCFMMGTLFFVLHLSILGYVPQIFYECEISWLAAYLFFLSLLLLRAEALPLPFSFGALLPALVAAAAVLIFRIFGPAWPPCIAFSLTLGVIVYLSSRRILFELQNQKRPSPLDLCFLLCAALQTGIYIISIFMEDFIHFNLYFAADMLLTAALASLLPLLHREVCHL